ncbi:acyl-CoA thioesterase [Blastopirellula marina]|uniref:Acyl-CoA thioesterase n=1 Tax=Blastopirellula marina TaxID=124 RepID=A0A2S8G1V2_9BACT|nr:acyl-CoA thioesterase [Blastopirellula marina]PQO38403.1 acyl-CoA thioesterase [Blastopirellula marina]PTL45060.1 acyl-CoA thioesterase [Blastopirellula marina]
MLTNIYHHKIEVVSDNIDLQGHVNNLVYLKWMQDAAVAHSVEKGWGQAQYDQLRCGWVVRSHQIEYRWPAFENDSLEIVTWVESFRRASCVRKYEVHRLSDQKILAIAETHWAFLDLDKRIPAKVPQEIILAFQADGAPI